MSVFGCEAERVTSTIDSMETVSFEANESIDNGFIPIDIDSRTAAITSDSIAQLIAFAKASSPMLNPDRINFADLKIDWLKFRPGSREQGLGLEKPLVELDSIAYFNLVNPNDSASAFYLDPCFVSESCDGVKWRWEKNKWWYYAYFETAKPYYQLVFGVDANQFPTMYLATYALDGAIIGQVRVAHGFGDAGMYVYASTLIPNDSTLVVGELELASESSEGLICDSTAITHKISQTGFITETGRESFKVDC